MEDYEDLEELLDWLFEVYQDSVAVWVWTYLGGVEDGIRFDDWDDDDSEILEDAVKYMVQIRDMLVKGHLDMAMANVFDRYNRSMKNIWRMCEQLEVESEKIVKVLERCLGEFRRGGSWDSVSLTRKEWGKMSNNFWNMINEVNRFVTMSY